MGLIDTGADNVVIPGGLARIIGYDITSGRVSNTGTAGGSATAYEHIASLEIRGFRTGPIKVDIMPELQILLLGTKNFLSRFYLTIDYPNKKFRLRLS